MPKQQEKAKQEGIADRARDIWLAGLGLFATMEEEGTKMFHSFVEKGKDLEKKGEEFEKKAKEGMESVAAYFSSRQGELSKLTQFVEDKVNASLEKIGVATQDEVKDLEKKVDKLSRQVAELTKKLEK